MIITKEANKNNNNNNNTTTTTITTSAFLLVLQPIIIIIIVIIYLSIERSNNLSMGEHPNTVKQFGWAWLAKV